MLKMQIWARSSVRRKENTSRLLCKNLHLREINGEIPEMQTF